jgi:hypothetical protein
VVLLERKAGLVIPSPHEMRISKQKEQTHIPPLTTRQLVDEKKTAKFLELFQEYGNSPQPEFYR